MTEAIRASVHLPAHARTLPALLKAQAERFGAAPLVRVGGVQWTHADAPLMAGRRAAALQQAGVARGDTVALLCGNRIEFLACFLGCGWMGAAAVPINTASMGPQIAYYLANSRARLLVIEAAFLDRLRDLDLAAGGLQQVWVLPQGPGDLPMDLPHAISGVPCQSYPSDAPDQAPVDAAPVQAGDTLAVMYTSGTTGPSKGVTCPHAQYYGWGEHSRQVLGLGADDVLCTTLPLFHINALNTFAQACVSGCQVSVEARFSASGFWATMAERGATVAYLLGAMVPILLSLPPGAQERRHRIRVVLGPGVPGAAAQAFEQRTGVRLVEGYGSTETNFVIATGASGRRHGIMGWVRPGFQAQVVDEQDVPLPDGQAGELVLRSDEPFEFATGYLGMPAKTVEAWRNLWFHTGDRVVREADGAFRFIDRLKDAIRRRGENISSYEVEQVLLTHPAVAEVAVFPVRSELAEDEVMAAVIPGPASAQGLAADLARHCETRLPYFAIPRYVDVVADFPRTSNGKVRKFELRERGVTPTTWDRLTRS